MSILDDWFGGGSGSSTTTVDSFERLPEPFKRLLTAQANTGTRMTRDVEEARNAYSDPDRAVAPLNSVERAGLDRVVNDSRRISRMEGDAAAAGRTARNIAGGMRGITAGAGLDEGMDLVRGAAPTGAQGAIDAMGGVDVDAYTRGYEDPYVDQVVGTTLESMSRESERRKMLEDSRAAAIGGTTNSRRAVADMLENEMTAREMAKTEGALRSDAFKYARDMGLKRGDFELGRQGDIFNSTLDLSESETKRGDALARLGLDNADMLIDRDTAAGGLMVDAGDLLGRTSALTSARGLAEGAYMQTFGEKARGLDQARIDAPRDALSWQAAILGDIDTPENRTSTTSTSGGNSWAQLAGGALAAYGAFS